MLFQRWKRPYEITAHVPALTPLISVPHEQEEMMHLIGSDPGKRLNPGVGLGKATQHGHKAAFPQHQFWRGLPAGEVSARCFDAAHAEVTSSLGTRPQRWLHVRKQSGSQGRGALLPVGPHRQEVFVRPAVAEAVSTGQER